MGAYVMGLVDEERLFALENAPDRRCEIAYALGVRAWAESRMQDAVDWFRVVVETEQPREFEHIWAVQHLDWWRSQGRRLADRPGPATGSMP
jgi:hypothetical protein